MPRAARMPRRDKANGLWPWIQPLASGSNDELVELHIPCGKTMSFAQYWSPPFNNEGLFSTALLEHWHQGLAGDRCRLGRVTKLHVAQRAEGKPCADLPVVRRCIVEVLRLGEGKGEDGA